MTLLKGAEKRRDDMAYLQWVVWGQLDVDFKAFKEQQKPKPKRSAKSILKEVDGYIEMFNKGYTRVQ